MSKIAAKPPMLGRLFLLLDVDRLATLLRSWFNQNEQGVCAIETVLLPETVFLSATGGRVVLPSGTLRSRG
jgi:hypothetical protein